MTIVAFILTALMFLAIVLSGEVVVENYKLRAENKFLRKQLEKFGEKYL